MAKRSNNKLVSFFQHCWEMLRLVFPGKKAVKKPDGKPTMHVIKGKKLRDE